MALQLTPKLRNRFNVEGQVRQLETVPMSPLHFERHNQEASMWNSVTWSQGYHLHDYARQKGGTAHMAAGCLAHLLPLVHNIRLC